MLHQSYRERLYFADEQTRDLSDIAASYCIAKLAYAAGEDEAGDAAWGRFIDETSSDEREQIEAQLEYEYPGVKAWAACVVDLAEWNLRQAKLMKAKLGVVRFIEQVMA
jgi:hypothetical protein